MDQVKYNYQESDFEGDDFVKECLTAFDEGVAEIEKEYEIKSKSA